MDKTDIYKFRDSISQYAGVPSKPIVIGKVIEPDITVLIPTYKRMETLMLTVKSAVEQTETDNYEILIVDNDPDSETEKIKSFLSSFHSDKISYYVNEKNLGLCGNWNRGIELAKGSYIAMIHDDDLLSPYFLSAVRQAVREQNDPGIIGVDYKRFDSSGLPSFIKPERLNYRQVTKRTYFFGRYINIAGMTFKRALALKIGGFSEAYYPNQDSVFIYQALLLGQVVNIEHSLAGYRVEKNLSLSGDNMKNVILTVERVRKNIAEHEKFAYKWMKKYDDTFLYQYVQNANRYWSLKIDYQEIFQLVSIDKKSINPIKLKWMKVLLKLEQLRKVP